MSSSCAYGSPSPSYASPPAFVTKTCFSSLRLAALGLILPFLCTSCADLSAVAKFAASAKGTSAGFSDIAADFAGSATRRSLYVSDKEKPNVLSQAETYKAQEPDMLAAQKVLVDYVAALAAISTDSTTTRDASVQATQAGLQKIGMTANQATAGVGLATKIVDALTAGYRSNKAGKVIHDCNPQLQEYLKGLEQIAGTDYWTIRERLLKLGAPPGHPLAQGVSLEGGVPEGGSRAGSYGGISKNTASLQPNQHLSRKLSGIATPKIDVCPFRIDPGRLSCLKA